MMIQTPLIDSTRYRRQGRQNGALNGFTWPVWSEPNDLTGDRLIGAAQRVCNCVIDAGADNNCRPVESSSVNRAMTSLALAR